MAGEWIVMQTRLASEKHVVFVRKRCGLFADEVVGKLHRFWSWADGETEDGVIDGVDFGWVNEFLGAEGFAEALAEFPEDPWLVETDEGIEIPNYQTYTGKSARKRLLDNRRKTSARRADKKRIQNGQSKDDARTDGGQKAPEKRTRSTTTTTVPPPTPPDDANESDPVTAIESHFCELTGKVPYLGSQQADGQKNQTQATIRLLAEGGVSVAEMKEEMSKIHTEFAKAGDPIFSLPKTVSEITRRRRQESGSAEEDLPYSARHELE